MAGCTEFVGVVGQEKGALRAMGSMTGSAIQTISVALMAAWLAG